MTLLGKLDYEQGLNDVWGFSDKQDNEYAIVGLVNGTSIVDVTNPSSLNEIAFVKLPLWDMLKPPPNKSAKKGCMFLKEVSPVVE